MPRDPYTDQPEYAGTADGEIQVHLNLNKFRIQLHDGIVVDAVMPDDLIEQVRPFFEDRTDGPDRIRVTVQFRLPPAMPLITEVRGNGAWCGIARAHHR